MADSPVLGLERELLECCVDSRMGETTTQLDEEMLEMTPGRPALERALRGLVSRGLMQTSRGTFGGRLRSREGDIGEIRVFEDDWWEVTDEGRAAIGLPPWSESRLRWMQPRERTPR